MHIQNYNLKLLLWIDAEMFYVVPDGGVWPCYFAALIYNV